MHEDIGHRPFEVVTNPPGSRIVCGFPSPDTLAPLDTGRVLTVHYRDHT